MRSRQDLFHIIESALSERATDEETGREFARCQFCGCVIDDYIYEHDDECPFKALVKLMQGTPNKTLVFITTKFPAFHRWPGAPAHCDYLRDTHRHLFHVEMKWPVNHDDRDIEFITQKTAVENWIYANWYGKDVGALSCEMMARALCKKFKAVYAKVSEDGENGAEVTEEEV